MLSLRYSTQCFRVRFHVTYFTSWCFNDDISMNRFCINTFFEKIGQIMDFLFRALDQKVLFGFYIDLDPSESPSLCSCSYFISVLACFKNIYLGWWSVLLRTWSTLLRENTPPHHEHHPSQIICLRIWVNLFATSAIGRSVIFFSIDCQRGVSIFSRYGWARSMRLRLRCNRKDSPEFRLHKIITFRPFLLHHLLPLTIPGNCSVCA